MKHPRTVWKAAQHWLNFEAECKRYDLFYEASMAYPIGQYLRERYRNNLWVEYEHPVLTDCQNKNGDNPRLDFAVVQDDDNVKFAMEMKWFSGDGVGNMVEGVVRDLARLEILTNKGGCSSYFLVGGKEKNLNRLFRSKHFSASNQRYEGLLPIGDTNSSILQIRRHHSDRTGYWKRALEPLRGCSVANSIKVERLCNNDNPDSDGEEVNVFAWRITKRPSINRSNPESFIEYGD